VLFRDDEYILLSLVAASGTNFLFPADMSKQEGLSVFCSPAFKLNPENKFPKYQQYIDYLIGLNVNITTAILWC
jgi:hypothetical protein